MGRRTCKSSPVELRGRKLVTAMGFNSDGNGEIAVLALDRTQSSGGQLELVRIQCKIASSIGKESHAGRRSDNGEHGIRS